MSCGDLLISFVLLAGLTLADRLPAAPACDNASVRLDPDYRYFIGSSWFLGGGEVEAGSTFRWLTNGAPLLSGQVAEGLLLNFDATVAGAGGETPASAQNPQYTAGQWSSGLAMPPSGKLQYSRTNNLSLDEGTIEMWVALREDGTNATYSARNHTLFHYKAADGSNYLRLAQSSASGVLYGGGNVNGQWESAYGSRASTRTWLAGEWHHIAFTFSTPQNFMRFYLDGALTAQNNEGHYWAPPSDGAVFAIAGDLGGNNAHYYLDALRISGRVAEAGELAARAGRRDAPQPNEIWLATTNAALGSSVVFEFTPVSSTQTGALCQSASLIFSGVPIVNPQPPATLLPVGTTNLDLSVQTVMTTACAYAVGQIVPYAQMTPFNTGAGSTNHSARIAGLNSDPNTVNDVYVRCAGQPDYLLHLQYRALSRVNPSFPRTGNLWGWSQWQGYGLPDCAKVDLWLGVSLRPETIRELRRLNPHIRILTSINAVENHGLPDDYYLKDVNGQRIEVWPDSYRLNLTKNYVAEYQARYAYQTMLDSGMMADGVFFDNVMTTQSWLDNDIYGNPVQIDTDENGVPDDPVTLDAAWKAGVFHEIELFRQWMPHAIVSGHSTKIDEPGIAGLFNGVSFGFQTANVIEAERSFSDFWDEYQKWFATALQPVTVMIESSPTDQIAYGYDYSPAQKIPPSTLEFARTYFPWMRFGLAFTLLGDGFFAQEYGDTWHGNHWWYDELDFELGYPLGLARRVDIPGTTGTNLIVNAGFEAAIADPWRLGRSGGSVATVTRQTTDAPEGSVCARIDITSTTGTDWHVDFAQWNRSLVKDANYDLTFFAKSAVPRPLRVNSQKGTPDWRNYGLSKKLNLTTNWQEYTVSFTAKETVSDARLQFFVGETNATVWLDNVRLTLHPPDVYRRDFQRGMVLLNASRQTRELSLESGLRRLVGAQAPLVEFILDNNDSSFTTNGIWTNVVYDSGKWKATPPFFHSWAGPSCQRESATGEAQWLLPIEIEDAYTISAWWPAAPAATNWTHNALFEVVSNGVVVASTNYDQTMAGDEWHPIATVSLSSASNQFVRLSAASGVCVADALLIRSQSRYNNGQPAPAVRLQPLDGIILQRDTPLGSVPCFSEMSCSQGKVLFTVTNLIPGYSYELLHATNLFATNWTAIHVFQAADFATNLTDRISVGNEQNFYRVRRP